MGNRSENPNAFLDAHRQEKVPDETTLAVVATGLEKGDRPITFPCWTT
ncbi:MAG: hypothetical protein AAFY26_13335 [Cyanobacteria bacterium J06638_22]